MDAMETVRTTPSAPSRPAPGRDDLAHDRGARSGFSLIELAIVLSVLGLLLALTIPRYKAFLTTQRLHGSVENLAAEVRIARERAMATGVDQQVHFLEDTFNGDYHLHNSGVVSQVWSFPPGIHYTFAVGTLDTLRMKKDGTASPAHMIVLKDTYNRRDTLSVLSSGIVLVR